MAIQQVTDPMMLDSTGQDIVQKLELIKQAVQPTNACIDVDVSLPTTGWTGNGPYTYTYNNAHISTGCKVKVNFLETESTSGGVLYLEYEKIVGGVQFTAQSVPTDPIPVRIHILNADAESIMATTADEVSTNAVAGASNVEQALSAVSDDITDVNDKVGDVPSGQTVEGQIEALNSKIADFGDIVLLKETTTIDGSHVIDNINNYRFIVHVISGSSQVHIFTPVEVLKLNTTAAGVYINASGERIGGFITLQSDTSVRLYGYATSGYSFTQHRLYGVK